MNVTDIKIEGLVRAVDEYGTIYAHTPRARYYDMGVASGSCAESGLSWHGVLSIDADRLDDVLVFVSPDHRIEGSGLSAHVAGGDCVTPLGITRRQMRAAVLAAIPHEDNGYVMGRADSGIQSGRPVTHLSVRGHHIDKAFRRMGC